MRNLIYLSFGLSFIVITQAHALQCPTPDQISSNLKMSCSDGTNMYFCDSSITIDGELWAGDLSTQNVQPKVWVVLGMPGASATSIDCNYARSGDTASAGYLAYDPHILCQFVDPHFVTNGECVGTIEQCSLSCSSQLEKNAPIKRKEKQK